MNAIGHPVASPMDAAQLLGMTELEESLLGPGSKAAAAALMERLARADETIANQLQQGMSPDAYETGKRARIAIAAAREIALLFQ